MKYLLQPYVTFFMKSTDISNHALGVTPQRKFILLL